MAPLETSASAAAPQAGSLIGSLEALWRGWRITCHQQLELAALEFERAARSLVAMVAFGVASGVLAASAWLGLLAASALWLIDIGFAPALALLAGVLGNVGGIVALLFALRRRSHDLQMPATVASLAPQRP